MFKAHINKSNRTLRMLSPPGYDAMYTINLHTLTLSVPHFFHLAVAKASRPKRSVVSDSYI